MAYQISVTVCLLWVCVLAAGRFLMVVKGEPTVSLTIETPVAERKEGGTVRMRCVAANLVGDQVLELNNTKISIVWNGSFINSLNRRLTFNSSISNGVITQDFNITNLHKYDTDEYWCNVVHQMHVPGRGRLAATSTVSLSVLYFPDEPFPMCFPDGPITVDSGTELTLRCSSEAGTSAVMMEVSEIPAACDTHLWTTSVVSDTLIRSLTLTAGSSTNNASFKCTISSAYYPGMRRSCTIGPLIVNGVTKPVHCSTTDVAPDELLLLPPDTIQTVAYSTTASLINIPPIASLAVVVGFILGIAFSIVVFHCALKQGYLNRLLRPTDKTQEANASPYTDLQLTGKGNREYTGLTPKETSGVKQTYFTPMEASSKQGMPTRADGGYVNQQIELEDTQQTGIRKPAISAAVKVGTKPHYHTQIVSKEDDELKHDEPEPNITDYERVNMPKC